MSGYRFTIVGTTHMSFSDQGLLPFVPESVKAGMGTIDPSRAIRLTATYIDAFFDKYLNDRNSSLLEKTSPDYPEVTIEKNNGIKAVAP
jgi:hypothetical protein